MDDLLLHVYTCAGMCLPSRCVALGIDVTLLLSEVQEKLVGRHHYNCLIAAWYAGIRGNSHSLISINYTSHIQML
jgi:hypothetical protein